MRGAGEGERLGETGVPPERPLARPPVDHETVFRPVQPRRFFGQFGRDLAHAAVLGVGLILFFVLAPPVPQVSRADFHSRDGLPALSVTVTDQIPMDEISEWERDELISRFSVSLVWKVAQYPELEIQFSASDDRPGPPFVVEVIGEPEWDLPRNCELIGNNRTAEGSGVSVLSNDAGQEVGLSYRGEGGRDDWAWFTCSLPSALFFKESGQFRRYYVPTIGVAQVAPEVVPKGTEGRSPCIRYELPAPDDYEELSPDPRVLSGCTEYPTFEGFVHLSRDAYFGTTYNISLQSDRELRMLWAGVVAGLATTSALSLLSAAGGRVRRRMRLVDPSQQVGHDECSRNGDGTAQQSTAPGRGAPDPHTVSVKGDSAPAVIDSADSANGVVPGETPGETPGA